MNTPPADINSQAEITNSNSTSATPPISTDGLLPARNRPEMKAVANVSTFLSPTQFHFRCIYANCEFQCEMTNDLYVHIRSHGKAIECPYCGIKRGSLSVMVNHVRSHSGERPYRCPLPHCEFASSTKGILRQHMVSRRHKSVMSLELMNDILSWDTHRGRPQRKLRGPRERVNEFDNQRGAEKRDVNKNKMLFAVPAPFPLRYMAAPTMLPNPYATYHQQAFSVSSIRNSPMMCLYPGMNNIASPWTVINDNSECIE